MSKDNNLHDFLQDVADAIREKKGSNAKINAQNFASEIKNLPSGGGSASGWTGHADVEGLKAIGWDDDDIAYYQQHGVNWNAEDDEYHKVSEDNKALYGVLTASNIAEYKDRIVYLPKIDTSGLTTMTKLFQNCYVMVAMPTLNTSNVTSMSYMCDKCYCLVAFPPLNTAKVNNMSYMLQNCYSLSYISPLDTANVTTMIYMYYNCYSINGFPSHNTEKVNNMSYMLYNCYALVATPIVDLAKVTALSSTFNNCRALILLRMKNVNKSLDLKNSPLLSKESLTYLIDNEAASDIITITLHSYVYDMAMNDSEIEAKLQRHPNISLATA